MLANIETLICTGRDKMTIEQVKASAIRTHHCAGKLDGLVIYMYEKARNTYALATENRHNGELTHDSATGDELTIAVRYWQVVRDFNALSV